MWRGTRVLRKETGMKLVNLVREECSKRLRQSPFSSLLYLSTSSSSIQATLFSYFIGVTTDEVFKLLSRSPDTNCDLDPIPTSLVKQCSHILLPTLTKIVNPSVVIDVFPDQLKCCQLISPQKIK